MVAKLDLSVVDRNATRKDTKYTFPLNRHYSPLQRFPYSYYETHLPTSLLSERYEEEFVTKSEVDKEYDLDDLVVKSKKRKRRQLDYTKPNLVVDYDELMDKIEDLYYTFTHDVTDLIMVYSLYDSTTILRNSPRFGIKIEAIHVFSDLISRERYGFSMKGVNYTPDVVFEYKNSRNEKVKSRRNTIRYTTLQGFSETAEFYNPDYRNKKPAASTQDYRRTLYWNPNVKFDSEGKATVKLYNNNTESKIRVDAQGVTIRGDLIVYKE